MKSFFISYNSADRAWAEWIAWQLEADGYSTVIQAWDFRPGSNFVLEMQKAASQAERTIAVLSPNYLTALYTQPEWAAAFAKDPTGEKGALVGVLVRECELTGLLAQIVYIKLIGLDDAAAKNALLEGMRRQRAKPSLPPGFPGVGKTSPQTPPRYPGTLPAIWNVPHRRNPNFTGRDRLLDQLRQSLIAEHAAAVTQAITGLGGVGKTQLAVEYAYRFASDYDLVWWIRSEQTAALAAGFAAVATPLKLPEKDATDQNTIVAAVRHWLEHQRRWLLIFDNAIDAVELRAFLPQGNTGHVLLTSRNPSWRGLAQPLPVKVWERAASVDFLLKRTGQKDEFAASQLAEALGDLPLALEQAGAYLEETGNTVAGYLALFRTRHAELLKRPSTAADYPDTVATTWELSFVEILKTAPAAIDLLNLFAFLAPDDIPRELLTHKDILPDSLKAAVADALLLDNAIAALRRFSLIEATGDAFALHRLVQAIVQDRLKEEEKKFWVTAAVRVVNKAFPFDSDDVRTWAECSLLLPHALAVTAHAETTKMAAEETTRLLNQVALYSKGRAQFIEAKSALERALQIDEAAYGPNHPTVASILNNLGGVLEALGDLSGARQHYERALQIFLEFLGTDHPNTVIVRNNLNSMKS